MAQRIPKSTAALALAALTAGGLALAALIVAIVALGDDSAPASADAPFKSDPDAYTRWFVGQALERYEASGLEETVAYYNTAASVDGQWYVFIIDGDDTMIAHAANPDFVGRHVSATVGPNGYPAGLAVAAAASEDGGWIDYSFPNFDTGAAETKHSWIIRHDGLIFGSGWYERGPSKADAPAYTQAFVREAVNLYNALGLEETVAYYNTEEHIDDQWYVFIVNGDGYTISHYNPALRWRDPSLRIDPTGYFYGDDLLAATETGRWVNYVIRNPESGQDQRKHTWAVRHDGFLFGSGWYEALP